jgi:hypothetical protein
MCKSACANQKIVWANSKACEGIVGPGVPLHTAVSVPACIVGADICVVVLLSTHVIEITPRAVQFLCAIMSAIPYYDKDFVQLASHITSFPSILRRPADAMSDLKESTELLFVDQLHDVHGGFDVHVQDLTEMSTLPDGSVNGIRSSWSYLRLSDLWNPTAESGLAIVDGRRSYEELKERYHELMIGLLYLTAFEITELWLVDDSRADRMTVVAAFHTEPSLQPWAAFTRLLSLNAGTDIPGLVLQNARPVMDMSYCEHNQFDIAFPRAAHARSLGIQSALGVPLPSSGTSNGVCGALVLYSRQSVNIAPCMVTMITAAAYLLAGSAALRTDQRNISTAPQPPAPTNPSQETLSRPTPPSVWAPGASDVDSKVPFGGDRQGQECSGEEAFEMLRTTYDMEACKRHDSDDFMPSDHSHYHQHVSAAAAPPQSYEEDSSKLIDYAFSSALEFFCADLDGAAWPGDDLLDGPMESAEGPLTEPISSFPDGGRKRTRTASRNNSFSALHEAELTETACRRCSRQLMPGRSRPSMLCENCEHVTGGGGAHAPLALMPPDAMPMYPSVGQQQRFSMPPQWTGSSMGLPLWMQQARDMHDDDWMQQHHQQQQHLLMTESPSVNDMSAVFSQMHTNTGSDKKSRPSPSPKICKHTGCENTTMQRSPYCAAHAGSRKCHHEGCTKCAQGSTKYCIAHGGGRRCTFPGCTKGARDRFFCAAHGGGKRCISEGCHKSAVGSSKYCTNHGGGKRCKEPGCQKSAQSSTHYCVRHGGGRKCVVDGCTRVSAMVF